MPKKETIEIRDLAATVEEERLVITMKLFNPEQRTMYAYQEPQQILYDNATGKLTLRFHDQDAEEDTLMSEHLSEPSLAPLEGKTETDIKISLPSAMNRLKTAAERDGIGPLFEQLRVSEAKEVELEVAYNGTPFYENPNIVFARQLREWGRNIARAKFKLRPQTGKE